MCEVNILKILVISDTHGQIMNAVNLIKKGTYDYCIHLGDVVRDCEDLESIFPRQKFIFVKGNNDFWTRDASFPDERTFTLGGKKFFICHGHKFNVKSSLALLKSTAIKKECDVVLFGHTHKSYLEDGSLTVMNPGCVKSYGEIIIDDEGNMKSELKKVNDDE